MYKEKVPIPRDFLSLLVLYYWHRNYPPEASISDARKRVEPALRRYQVPERLLHDVLTNAFEWELGLPDEVRKAYEREYNKLFLVVS